MNEWEKNKLRWEEELPHAQLIQLQSTVMRHKNDNRLMMDLATALEELVGRREYGMLAAMERRGYEDLQPGERDQLIEILDHIEHVGGWPGTNLAALRTKLLTYSS